MDGIRGWIEGAVFLGLSTIAAYLFIGVPDYVSGWSLMLPGTTDRSLAPTFFPRLALAALASIAALNGFMALRNALGTGVGGEISADAEIHSPVNAIGWMLMLIGYLAVMWAIGFYLSSVLLIFILGFLSGYRHRLVLALVAIAIPAAVEIVFSRGLSLRLPVGRWLDFSITTAGMWA